MAINFFAVIGITLLLSVVGGGLGWFFFVRSRSKKVVWFANVYQLGLGVRKGFGDVLELSDLRPYCKDILEKVDKEHGITIFKLVKCDMTTNAVVADLVTVWGDRKEVDVLVVGSTATLLKKGYDKGGSELIFEAMPRERIELIKSEIEIKKNRLQREKNVLQAITPWIVAGICIMGLIGIVYILGDAHVKSSESIAEAQLYGSDKAVEAASIYRDALAGLGRSVEPILKEKSLGRQEEPPPTSVE